MKKIFYITNKSKITNRLIFQNAPQAQPSAPSESGNPAESKEQQSAIAEAKEMASATVSGIFTAAIGRAQNATAKTKQNLKNLASLNLNQPFNLNQIFQNPLGGFHLKQNQNENNQNSENNKKENSKA